MALIGFSVVGCGNVSSELMLVYVGNSRHPLKFFYSHRAEKLVLDYCHSEWAIYAHPLYCTPLIC